MIDNTIPTGDLKIEVLNPYAKGGQHAWTPLGVRIEHLPTGTVAIVRSNHSQHKNVRVAVRMIQAAITDLEFMP